MKWLAVNVSIFLFIFCSTSIVFSQEKLDEGFAGTKFGQNPPKNFKKIPQVDPSSPGDKVKSVLYESPKSATPDLFGIPVKNAYFKYCKNKLVEITITTIKVEREKSFKTFYENFGSPSGEEKPNSFTKAHLFIWELPNSTIQYSIAGDNTSAAIITSKNDYCK